MSRWCIPRTRELERAIVLGDGEGAALAKAHQAALTSLARLEIENAALKQQV